jgi:hypothetical protein
MTTIFISLASFAFGCEVLLPEAHGTRTCLISPEA